MYQNSIFSNSPTMDGGGMITGTWQNTRNGDIVTVRDSYIDGDEIVIVLTNGRTLSMNEFSDYVQMDASSEDLVSLEKNKKEADRQKLLFDGLDTTTKPKPSKILAQLGDESLINTASADDSSSNDSSINNPSINNPSLSNLETRKSGLSKESEMVLKVLEKAEAPKINISIDWPGYPKQAMETLISFFNTKDEDIVNAICHKYCTISSLEEAIRDWWDKS